MDVFVVLLHFLSLNDIKILIICLDMIPFSDIFAWGNLQTLSEFNE